MYWFAPMLSEFVQVAPESVERITRAVFAVPSPNCDAQMLPPNTANAVIRLLVAFVAGSVISVGFPAGSA